MDSKCRDIQNRGPDLRIAIGTRNPEIEKIETNIEAIAITNLEVEVTGREIVKVLVCMVPTTATSGDTRETRDNLAGLEI